MVDLRPKRTLASALIWSALSLFSSEVIGGERTLRSGAKKRKKQRDVSKSHGSRSELRMDEIGNTRTIMTHLTLAPPLSPYNFCLLMLHDYHLCIYQQHVYQSKHVNVKANWDMLEADNNMT